jgi:hypothetical protein
MKPPKPKTSSAVQAAWWKCPGAVYFFGAGTPLVAIKIGVAAVGIRGLAEAIRRRQREIQTSNHEIVELLGLIRFTDDEFPTQSAEVLERELHMPFASLQRFVANTRGAEWFAASDDILAYIQEHTESPESLGLPRIFGKPVLTAQRRKNQTEA